MKNIIKSILVTAIFTTTSISFGQVRFSNSTTHTAVTSSSAFIDASSNSTSNASTNVGKGLIYPRTDLTSFAAFGGSPIGVGASFPTRFDGMIVYNTATSGVAGVGSTQGTLSPGFWYYDNKSTSTNGGMWKPIGSNPSVDIKTNETTTNTLVNGSQVYATKGAFTATGSSAFVSVAVPFGMSGLYKMTIFKPGGSTVFATGVQTFNVATSTNNVVTGEGMITQVYPSGTYDYVLEYFK